MSTIIKLYDMDTSEWREAGFKRGDTWRSTKVYRCEICRTKTNIWIMGGSPGMGPRIVCPGDPYKEHDDIESARKGGGELDGGTIRLLELFCGRFEDVIGVGHSAEVEDFYPSSRFYGLKKSILESTTQAEIKAMSKE